MLLFGFVTTAFAALAVALLRVPATGGGGKLRALERRLRGQGELVANLAHELRSPLKGILGAAERLEADQANGPQMRLLLGIRRSIGHVLRVTDDTLELARLERQPPRVQARAFDIETVVADALTACEPLRDPRVQFGAEMDPGMPMRFEGDPDRLRQVLTNLLGNALSHTRSGVVLVRIRQRPDDVEIRVSDTGCGIPRRLLPRVFVPFVQGAGSVGSAGLGLTIVARLTTLLGGDVRIIDTSGAGTTLAVALPLKPLGASIPAPQGARKLRFGIAEGSAPHRHALLAWLEHWRIAAEEFESLAELEAFLEGDHRLDGLLLASEWLHAGALANAFCRRCRQRGLPLLIVGDRDRPRPLLPGDLARALEAMLDPATAEPMATGGQRVLVVDDHPLVAATLAAAVREVGGVPLPADSGPAALAIARSSPAIDVVLLDRRMPGMDGLDTARALRQQPATREAHMVLLVNDLDEALDIAAETVDDILLRPAGRAALQRALLPLLRAASPRRDATDTAVAFRGMAAELVRSLRDDLEICMEAVRRHALPELREREHRMRGALRICPDPRHQPWLDRLHDALDAWDAGPAPQPLLTVLEEARRAVAAGERP